MNRRIATSVAASLMMTLSPAALFAKSPQVVTDIAPVHSLVARVMDGVGTPDLLVPQSASPHGS